MDPECRNISKLILPAIRASIAEIMSNEYSYRQREIAERLGVVQVAVSKYLSKRYSSEIEKLKNEIIEKGLTRTIVDNIIRGGPMDEIGMQIDELCGSIAKSMQAEVSA